MGINVSDMQEVELPLGGEDGDQEGGASNHFTSANFWSFCYLGSLGDWGRNMHCNTLLNNYLFVCLFTTGQTSTGASPPPPAKKRPQSRVLCGLTAGTQDGDLS